MSQLHVRFRRTADFTALRLGRAMLGYLVLVTSIITLAPFRFQWAPAHGLTDIWGWSDLVMNVLMFVPFGFVYQLTRPRGAAPDWPQVAVLGAAISGAIEILQLFSPMRYSSLMDVVANTTGAAVGAWLFARLARRLNDETAVRSFALELPLMGLVYQLIPLCWLIGLGSEGGFRRTLNTVNAPDEPGEPLLPDPLCLLDGVSYSFGVLLPPLMADLGAGRVGVAAAGSLQTGIYALAGLWVAKLVTR